MSFLRLWDQGSKSNAFKTVYKMTSLARLKRDIKKTSFLDDCCIEKLFYFTSLVGGETGCKSDTFKTSDQKTSLARSKRDSVKTSFLDHSYVKNFYFTNLFGE